MAEGFALQPSSMGKIQRWMLAKKAAGQVVQPWEVSAAYEGEFDALAKNRNASKGLSLQAARDAETVRMNDVNTGIRREEMGKAETASKNALAGQLTTAGLGLYYLGGKDKNPTSPGISDDLLTGGKKALSNIGTNVKKGFNSLTDTSGTVASGLDTPPIETASSLTSMDVGGESLSNINPGGTDIGTDVTSSTSYSPGPETSVSETVGSYLPAVTGGMIGEKLSEKTGLGEKTSEIMPFGGSQDWNRAAGSGVAAGLASLSGANPWVAAAGYLASSIGLKKLWG